MVQQAVMGSDVVDSWRLLRIRRGASFNAARSAWRARCRETHPDRHPELGTEPFKRVQQAWVEIQRTLGDHAAAPIEWDHARAVRYLTANGCLDVLADDDDRTTTFLGRGGDVVVLSDRGLSADRHVPWSRVTDARMEKLLAVLVGAD